MKAVWPGLLILALLFLVGWRWYEQAHTIVVPRTTGPYIVEIPGRALTLVLVRNGRVRYTREAPGGTLDIRMEGYDSTRGGADLKRAPCTAYGVTLIQEQDPYIVRF